MSTIKLPSVLAFDRKLEPSDGVMFSGSWQDIGNDKNWQPIVLFERRNRAVKSNFTQEVLDDEEALQKQIAEANLSWGDDGSLKHGQDTLRLSFSLRVVAGIQNPTACNNVEFESRFNEVISGYVQDDLQELANRYAYNIANGRFLWRNRVGAQQLKVSVNAIELSKQLEFNAYDFALSKTTSDDKDVVQLTQLILDGFKGEKNTVLQVEAFAQLGDAQRVWPSQKMVLNAAKGEKSRHLFSLDGVHGNDNVAAMHCEKIGNALRTIDDWYPHFEQTNKPIAIEAYGSVTQRGVAYRSTRNDFKTLLLKWLSSETSSQLTEQDKHFVVAMLIRGGVFGEGES
ncbi:type I-F CRISPR-associated protein Csy3 [Pseudoalteromonas citrea]|uniref:Type I-F CRISPR-associated protein Csy3 n=1 Tax=Pseudoalteromonas citrea TaxID=43655 RepID=A0A5S3XHV2_9GAMM|nr:type I-F CRISPR-associated protein Csy3 [Pseudoalteromonas citrea]TMP39755.1 type I-F CRISPR-associated protein Csy3 [Pseudoalteromonas citrea]TMP52114.1 type I-F CRISPR-associated protein Csy3 [Pseudoalteromonas citrea]